MKTPLLVAGGSLFGAIVFYAIVFLFRDSLLVGVGMLHPMFAAAHWHIIALFLLSGMTLLMGVSFWALLRAHRHVQRVATALASGVQLVREELWKLQQSGVATQGALAMHNHAFEKQSKAASAEYAAALEAQLKRLLAAMASAEAEYKSALAEIRRDLEALKTDVRSAAAVARSI